MAESYGTQPPPYNTYKPPPGYPGYPPTNPPPAQPYNGYNMAQNGPQQPMYHIDRNPQVHPEAVESNLMTTGNSFSDKGIRHAFIKKVYLIIMTQLLITVGFICLFLFCFPVKDWVRSHSWFYWISYGVFFVTYLLLVCIPAVRRSFPGNFICLLIFTLALSYMTASLSSYYDTKIVLIAMAITAGVTLAISLFAIQTKIDFTMCSGLIFAAGMVLMLFGIACLITYLIVGNTFATYVLSIVYGALAALVFSLFLVFDTQMVIGGKNRRNSLSPEEYISGALHIYLDIVFIFTAILGLTGAASR